MATDFEIIHRHLKEGSFADCLKQGDTICLSGLLQPKVWMIQGKEGIIAYFNLAERIHNKKIKSNYTFQHVEKFLTLYFWMALEKGM